MAVDALHSNKPVGFACSASGAGISSTVNVHVRDSAILAQAIRLAAVEPAAATLPRPFRARHHSTLRVGRTQRPGFVLHHKHRVGTASAQPVEVMYRPGLSGGTAGRRGSSKLRLPDAEQQGKL